MIKLLDKTNLENIKDLSYEELSLLSDEIREFLVEKVSHTGGHLASNLGIVELTISLLRNFDFNKDKIVFDVGHQSYVYKILTGRKDKFDTLRQHKGLSGFPKLSESKYDFFETGHSSTSISATVGMARARDLRGENHKVIALIGDGALTGGMVYEALNDVGYNKTNMIIILNDNEMSISSNVGGLSNHLNNIRISTSYNKLKEKVHLKLDRKKHLVNKIHKLKNKIKSLFINSSFFEDLGIRYIGPIDGHNIKELDRVLKKIKKINGPIVIHTKTKKGQGYLPAMENPDKFHGIGPFDITTGNVLKNNQDTYSNAFGKAIENLTKKDKSIVAITAAMASGTGLKNYKEKYQDNFFDVGIAEEHATTLAAGMASGGLKPVFVVYSTFLQRAFDQIIHDVCMPNLNVTFAIDRAGLVGADGKTHQGVFDLSYLSLVPNMTIVTPKCTEELECLLTYAVNANKPVAIRYPRGGDITKLKPLKKVKEGKWEVISKGEKTAVIATGKMVGYALLAKEKCKTNPMIINATFVKPLDYNLLNKLNQKNYNIITLEDNNIIGGFGNQILLYLNKIGYTKKVKILGYEDKFIEQGTIDELLKEEKLSVDEIVKIIDNISNK